MEADVVVVPEDLALVPLEVEGFELEVGELEWLLMDVFRAVLELVDGLLLVLVALLVVEELELRGVSPILILPELPLRSVYV